MLCVPSGGSDGGLQAWPPNKAIAQGLLRPLGHGLNGLNELSSCPLSLEGYLH